MVASKWRLVTLARGENNLTVSVTEDRNTNQPKDKGYAGAQIQLTATVKGDDSVAYNWQQTATQSDSANGHKPNVPFNYAAPDTQCNGALNQKKAMDAAAKQGGQQYSWMPRNGLAVFRLGFMQKRH